MAHMTDDELKDLKARAINAMGTGAHIGRAPEYLLQLIAEVEEHRAGGSKPRSRVGVLKVGEMDVKKGEEPASEPEAAAAPVTDTTPTVEVSPEETKELVEKTKKGGGKKGDKK